MFIKALLMFFGYFFIQFVGVTLLINIGQLNPEFASFFVSLILLVFALVLYRDHLEAEWHRFKQQVPNMGKFVVRMIGFYFLMLLLRVALIVVVSNFVNLETLGQNQIYLNEAASTLPVYATVILVSIYAPLVEELVFREAMLGSVKKDNKALVMISTLFSMFLFTFLHSFEWADFALYLPITVILTYIYWKYERNVIASIIFHFLNNTIAIVLMLYMLSTGTLL